MSVLVYYRDSDGHIMEMSPWREGASFQSGLDKFGAGYSAAELESVPDLQPLKNYFFNGTQVVLVDDQIQIDTNEKKVTDREAGLKKLKDLGLTDDQLTALFGG